jgi:hypothetical protein
VGGCVVISWGRRGRIRFSANRGAERPSDKIRSLLIRSFSSIRCIDLISPKLESINPFLRGLIKSVGKKHRGAKQNSTGKETGYSSSSRIRNIQHQKVCRANFFQFIHNNRNLLFQDHRAYSDPAWFFKGIDGRRSSAGRMFRCVFENGAGDVVLAEDVLLGRWLIWRLVVTYEEKWKLSCLLITPLIREAIRFTRLGFEGCFDFISTAELSTTVAIAFSPAAFIVSPDSNGQLSALEVQSVGWKRGAPTNEINNAIRNT